VTRVLQLALAIREKYKILEADGVEKSSQIDEPRWRGKGLAHLRQTDW